MATKKRVQNKNTYFGSITILILVFIITLMLNFSSCGSTKTIDLIDYISLNDPIGINGYGKVSCTVDYKKLFEDVLGKLNINDDTEQGFLEMVEYEDLCSELANCIVITESPNNGFLSNGDMVEITIEFDSTNSILDFEKNFNNGIVRREINDLQDGVPVDVFDPQYFQLSFKGINGYGYAEQTNTHSENWQKSIVYTLSKESGLSNDETITVTAQFKESEYGEYSAKLMELGYTIPKSSTKDFLVSDLKRLATADDITEDVIEQAKDAAMTYFNQQKNHDYDYDNIEIMGVYFKDKNDKSEPYFEWGSSTEYYTTLCVLISYSEDTHTFGIIFEDTACIEFWDIEIDDTGNFTSELVPEYGDTKDRCYTHADALREFFRDTDNYTVTKLQ